MRAANLSFVLLFMIACTPLRLPERSDLDSPMDEPGSDQENDDAESTEGESTEGEGTDEDSQNMSTEPDPSLETEPTKPDASVNKRDASVKADAATKPDAAQDAGTAAPLAAGLQCQGNGDCKSNMCSNNVCCQVECSPCGRCASTGLACEPLFANGGDTDACNTDRTCTGSRCVNVVAYLPTGSGTSRFSYSRATGDSPSIGQVVTMPNAGWLFAVRVVLDSFTTATGPVPCGSKSKLSLQSLAGGAPDGIPFAAGTYVGRALTNYFKVNEDFGLEEFSLRRINDGSTQVYIGAGTQFAIVVEPNSSERCSWASNNASDAPYPGGDPYVTSSTRSSYLPAAEGHLKFQLLYANAP